MSFFSHLFHTGNTEEKVDLVLYAPVNGTLLPLSEVPDPVISEKITGDGVALVPDSETILSPCDGVITRLLSTNTAFAVKTAEGVEVYVTFGIGTLDLQGEGFSSRVRSGEQVRRGQPVLQVDMAAISRKIQSAVTSMIVVRSTAPAAKVTAGTGNVAAGVTPCVWVTLNKDHDEVPAVKASSN